MNDYQEKNEWMQKMIAASNPKKIEEKDEKKEKTVGRVVVDSSDGKEKKSHSWSVWLFLGLSVLALLPRLYFIFFMSAPENAGVGWNGDTYHHWQIGYLTYTVGLHHGFLRLWDLKGMEYFWGPLDPLLLTAIFAITGNTSIVVTRILSSVFGVGSLFLLALLAKRYWGMSVAVATFLFGMLFPIAIQSDASGMLEPFGVFFMLLGIYFWPSLPVLTGVSWALATMVRAEAWLFSVGLLAGLFVLKKGGQKKVLTLIAWVVVMLVYMKYLLDSTGNAVYPVYWNFLANGLGAWADPNQGLTSLQLVVKPILMASGVFSALVLGFLLWRRPRGLLLYLLGFGTIFFVTAFMGFSHYIKGWEWWFPLIRFFVFSYIFMAMVLFIFISFVGKWNKHLMWLLVSLVCVIIIAVSQLTWGPVLFRFNETVGQWEANKQWGQEVGKYYTGGTVLFPDGEPSFTYTTVTYGHIAGAHILGEMFDPFYYLGQDKVFGNWMKYRKDIYSWITKNDIQLAVFPHDAKRYQLLVKKEPTVFEFVESIPSSNYEIWRVHPGNLPQIQE